MPRDPRPRGRTKRFSRVRRAIDIGGLVLLGFVLFVTWPQTLGGRVSYIMVSGHSMEPTMHLGDLAIIRSQSAYRVGDIVAYHVPHGEVGAGAIVIHRLVGGSARTGFTTRGDHNGYDDSWHPKSRDIVGTRWAVLPEAARNLSHLRGPLPLAGFAALLTALGAYEVLKPRNRRRQLSPRVAISHGRE